MAGDRKDIPLEALRGIAALTVLLWHTMLAFYPQGSGIFPGVWPKEFSLQEQPWFGMLNGGAAVTLFFVLSGFVLTRRFLLSGDQGIIARGALKRWPRLAGPVLVTVLVSWLLFWLHAYRYAQVGGVTASPWLSAFAYGIGPSFQPSPWDALKQGTFLTFFRGDATYDSSLWTMRLEFLGSFMCFGLALLVRALPTQARLAKGGLIVIVAMMCHFANPQYVAFPAGVALAAFLPNRRDILPGWASVALIIAAIYLFGSMGGQSGFFAVATWLSTSFNLHETHTIAAVLAIIAIELACEPFRKPISGMLARNLGKLSFPLYLIHIPVLCSVGCGAFLAMQAGAPTHHPRLVAAAVTVVAAILAALPLVWFNERWVGVVGRATDLALGWARTGSPATARPTASEVGT